MLPDPADLDLGRLVVSRGLLPREAVHAVHERRRPGETLAAALVAAGVLPRPTVEALLAELRGGPSASPAPPPAAAAPGARATLPIAPAPVPRASGRLGTAAPLAGAGAPAPRGAPDADPTVRTRAAGADATVRTPPPREAHPRPGTGAGGPARLPRPGEVVDGRYEVLDLLGQGGMGAVFRARDVGSGAGADPAAGLVALKVLLAPAEHQDALARFEREAQAAARVDDHPGVVRVRALGTHGGLPYAVMDLVAGRDLRAALRDGLALDEGLRIVEEVARAVDHCHRRGVVHRDLKPANVLLRASDGRAIVSDFGLALDASAERLTRTGEVMGTLAYMPPEQADGRKDEVDARSDVYALGAVLYEVATGSPPFQGESHEVLKRLFLDAPRPVRALRPDAPPALEAVCAKAMAKAREARYATAAALADDVARVRRGEPVLARAPGAWESLRWRLRRREPRAVLTVAALGAALLVGAGGLVAGEVLARRARREQDALRADLAALLGGRLEAADPLAAAEARTLAGDVLARIGGETAGDALARIGGETGGDEARVAALLDAAGRAAGDPVLSALRERGLDPAERLRRLARRLALSTGVAWRGPAPDPGSPAAEDALMAVLLSVGWGARPDAGAGGDARASEPLPDEEADRARARLEAVAASREPAGAAARRVLLAIARLDDDARGVVLEALAGRRAGPSSDRGADLGAGLPRLVPAAMRRAKAEALPGALAALRERLAALPRGSARLALRDAGRVLPAVGALAADEPALDAPGRERLRAEVTALLASHVLPRASPLDPASIDELCRLVAATPFVDWSAPGVVDRVRPALEDALAGGVDGRRGSLTLGQVMTLRRLGPRLNWPAARAAAGHLAALQALVAAPAPSGDACFFLGRVLSEQGETDDAVVVGHYAAALGEDLARDLRARLGLEAPRPLSAPLAPCWVTQARYRLGRAIARDALGAGPAALGRLDAALELLAGFRARAGDLPRDVLRASHEVAEVLHLAAGAYRASDPARADALLDEREALALEGAARAWRALRGQPEPDGVVEVENDREQVVRGLVDLTEHVFEQARDEGRHAAALEATRELHALASGATTDVRVDLTPVVAELAKLEVDRAWVALALGGAADTDAEASARAGLALERRALAAGAPISRTADLALCALALVRLRSGDRDGARALLAEARAGGGTTEPRWAEVVRALGD